MEFPENLNAFFLNSPPNKIYQHMINYQNALNHDLIFYANQYLEWAIALDSENIYLKVAFEFRHFLFF